MACYGMLPVAGEVAGYSACYVQGDAISMPGRAYKHVSCQGTGFREHNWGVFKFLNFFKIMDSGID